MKWLLHYANFYWPTMPNDCFRYYKSCESFQSFGDVQLTPAAMLHRIIKPSPFHGWALDFIGQTTLILLKAIDFFWLLWITSPNRRMMYR
jgi:hypothetical protein